MEPMEVLPGSHPRFATSPTMGYYGAIQGVVTPSAPAGPVFPAAYSIWHRRGASRRPSVCQLLKYNYWRTHTIEIRGREHRAAGVRSAAGFRAKGPASQNSMANHDPRKCALPLSLHFHRGA